MRRALVFLLTALTSLLSAGSALATPTVTRSGSVNPGGALTVTGSGFDPSVRVDVFWDTTDVATATSNASGAVSIGITIPANAQPGTHWITLDEPSTHLAAQASLTVYVNWANFGFTFGNRAYNPYENTLNTSNVSGLNHAWSAGNTGLANPIPFVNYHLNTYTHDTAGHVRAISPTGSLLWTATTTKGDFQIVPVASGSDVYFADSAGNVFAYAYSCRSDGGVCTPAWTANVGTQIPTPTSGTMTGLTVYNGLLYVPSNDGTFHKLNLTTGAAAGTVSANTANAPTTPISFGADGAYYYGAGSNFESTLANGVQQTASEAGAVSPVAVYNGTAYFTTQDGVLHAVGAATWTGTTSGGCGINAAPAVAYNLVYAGGCTTLAAFNPGSGAKRWSITPAGDVIGLSLAGGVLYACIHTTNFNFDGSLFAYDAGSGALLWNGGGCTGTPEVVNGTVYGGYIELNAYTLGAAGTSSARLRTVRRPNPRALRVTLHAHGRAHRVRRPAPRRSARR